MIDRAEADRQLGAILSRVKYIGPEPPSEAEVMDMAAEEVRTVRARHALSTSGLRTLDLPDGVRDVIVLADGDEPGERRPALAEDAGSRRAAACVLHGRRRGRILKIY